MALGCLVSQETVSSRAVSSRVLGGTVVPRGKQLQKSGEEGRDLALRGGGGGLLSTRI